MKKKIIFLYLLAALFFLFPSALETRAATLATPKLKTVKITSTGIKFTWGKVKKATGYKVLRKTYGSDKYSVIATVGKSNKTYVDTSVKSNVVYSYSVVAYRTASGSTSYSKYYSNGLTTRFIGTPRITSAEDSKECLSIYWSSVPGATAYSIYRKEGDGAYKKIHKCAGTYTGANDYTVKEGKTYTYQVRAHIGGDYGPKSSGYKVTHKIYQSSTEKDVVYRALLIGESIYSKTDPKENLSGPSNDVRIMKQMLKDMNYKKVNVLENATSSEILKGITSTFAGADSNDVCMFYFSGHGYTESGYDNNVYVESGALSCTNLKDSTDHLSLKTLAKALKALPCKVIVILDSCGSGAAITKGSSGEKRESLQPDIFQNQVLQAFFSPDSSEDELVGSGEFIQKNKFYVLSAAEMGGFSYTYVESEPYISLMTAGLYAGAGYAFSNFKWNGDMTADLNKDNAISLEEAYLYASTFVLLADLEFGYDQLIFRYPIDNSFTLYAR